jgi:hypothetical protein
MMRILQAIKEALLPTPQLPPVKGQVWKSGHSGRFIKITSVEITDAGSVLVYAAQHNPAVPDRDGIATMYAVGLAQWEQKLRTEARVLVS